MTEPTAEQPSAASGPPPELNPPQAEAVLHHDGPLLIFAGAGSGKTRVIVYRIANLVATHRVPPYRILAVTFTNKAAGEMRARLGGLLGEGVAKDLQVGTFHATCARFLRRYHEAAGLERSFVIYDDADQRSLMGRVLKELGYDEKRYPPRQVLSRIHAEKQEGRGPDQFSRGNFVDDAIAKCFVLYEQRLRQASAVDFDDLLLHVLRMLEDPENVAGEDLRKKFRHVLVDEFQDVNQVQYRLVKALAGTTQNLCVVGDDDQSIYRWRGADVRIVRGFRRDFPGATVVKLEQNYRSTENIVKAALGVIRHAKDREPKELWTDNAGGDLVNVIATETEHDEAAFVVERIDALMREGVSPREMAVFYRVHAQSRVLEEVLRANRIPYQIIGGMRFFERAEIKDCLSYLRVVSNPKSDVDLLRIINTPARKIGDSTVDKLVGMADRLQSSLFDAIVPLAEEPGALGTGAKNAIYGFNDLMQELMREGRTAPPSDLAQQVLERSGYLRMLEEDPSVEAETRKENLREFVGSILDYEQEAAAAGDEATLAGYLERVTLQSDADTIEDAPRVALMTVHAAKGLEFHAVFMTGMEQDLFPFRGLDPSRHEDVEEERRLAYVAITRARQRLWITHASRRAIFGTTRYGLPSQFIADMPSSSVRSGATSAARSRAQPGLAELAGRARAAWSQPQRGAWSHPQAGLRAGPAEPTRAPGERYVERDADEGGGRGQAVFHEKFGRGMVVSLDAGDDPIATVRFSGWGVKRIKSRFLRFGDDD